MLSNKLVVNYISLRVGYGVNIGHQKMLKLYQF